MAGGMRGVNPRQMQQTMRKMGIKQTNVDNVLEVIIRTKDNDIVITDAEVLCVDMKGERNYQVSGHEEIRASGSVSGSVTANMSFPHEDIELVMSQSGCDKDKAVEALSACDGQPAEAILKIIAG
jgi:nascent polypeptide-associated complex subunit alpha